MCAIEIFFGQTNIFFVNLGSSSAICMFHTSLYQIKHLFPSSASIPAFCAGV
jgi:hypothetical protein